MKNLILVIICSIWSSLSIAQDVLRRVSNSCELQPLNSGYINSLGDTVIPIGKYIYCYTETFDKIAIVMIKDKQGIYAIDRKENIVFQIPFYDNGPDPIKDGVFRIQRKEKYGYANMKGQIIIPPKYDFALPFSNGYAVVVIGGINIAHEGKSGHHGGSWGIINKKGHFVIKPIYEDARSVTAKGEVKLKQKGEWIIKVLNPQ